MIGVIAKTSEKPFVDEFFQLFKTPWEFVRDTCTYDVVIASRDHEEPVAASLVFYFASCALACDKRLLPSAASDLYARVGPATRIRDRQTVYPIYGHVRGFDGAAEALATAEPAGQPVAIRLKDAAGTVIRVGFDLFAEIDHLLTVGQPREFSKYPTLDRHIDFMRRTIVSEGQTLIEIPPAPKDYSFTVCLTHDVDFYRFRRHFLDRTFFGFIYRATLGTLAGVLKGRFPARRLLKNCLAALLVPFVYLGWVDDFWGRFDTYLNIEGKLPSTFFLIPRKDAPGKTEHGSAPPNRMVSYAINEIQGDIKKLLDRGCEIGLHGIDAWIDPQAAEEEMRAVKYATNQSSVGVRMHWLYFGDNSPRIVEYAGFFFDSTLGYNDAIGYRNGTVQAFALHGAHDILELPLNVMDTSLFYPDRLDLSEPRAWKEIVGIIDQHEQHGGVLTINWHLRSVSPERLWGDFYIRIIDELKRRNVWFATCSQAADWYRKRRAVDMNQVRIDDGCAYVHIADRPENNTPVMALKIHRPDRVGDAAATIQEEFTVIES